MRLATKRRILRGAAAGFVVEWLFATAMVVAAWATGRPLFEPVFGWGAVLRPGLAEDVGARGSALAVGLVVLAVLGVLFGALYAALVGRLGARVEGRYGIHAGLGALYGLALWALNEQILGRLFFPWLLQGNWLVDALVHALFFGVPLGLVVAGWQRPGPEEAAPRRAALGAT